MFKNNEIIVIFVGVVILFSILSFSLFITINTQRLEICSRKYGGDFSEIMYANFVSPKCYNPVTQETKVILDNK
jgi:hypothetical protein